MKYIFKVIVLRKKKTSCKIHATNNHHSDIILTLKISAAVDPPA